MQINSVVQPLIRGVFRSIVGSDGISTSGTVTVTSDTGTGTFYWVLTTSATPPSIAQVKAGQDHLGAAADSGSKTVTAAGSQNDSATGLASSTTYYPYFVHTNTGVDSDVLAGSSDST